MAKRNELTIELADREIVMRRMINAPREFVFDAFTKAEHLAKWFGPHEFTAEAESDPRPGGKYRIAMYGPADGPAEWKGPFPLKGVYTEFVRPERLAYTIDLSEHPADWIEKLRKSAVGARTEDVLNCENIVTFEDAGGKTLLTIRQRFISNAVRDASVNMGSREGWGESFEKLEELFATTEPFA
jgi:uncharacterized protein YndB with AHSA1/START domain